MRDVRDVFVQVLFTVLVLFVSLSATLYVAPVRHEVVFPLEGFLGKIAEAIPVDDDSGMPHIVEDTPCIACERSHKCISWLTPQLDEVSSMRDYVQTMAHSWAGSVTLRNAEYDFEQELPFQVRPSHEDPLKGKVELVVNDHGQKLWFDYTINLDE